MDAGGRRGVRRAPEGGQALPVGGQRALRQGRGQPVQLAPRLDQAHGRAAKGTQETLPEGLRLQGTNLI